MPHGDGTDEGTCATILEPSLIRENLKALQIRNNFLEIDGSMIVKTIKKSIDSILFNYKTGLDWCI